MDPPLQLRDFIYYVITMCSLQDNPVRTAGRQKGGRWMTEAQEWEKVKMEGAQSLLR